MAVTVNWNCGKRTQPYGWPRIDLWCETWVQGAAAGSHYRVHQEAYVIHWWA